MVRWADLEGAEPEFAARLRSIFDAHRHKILGTLRRDGSPRLSGIEADFSNGELWLGMMPDSLKALDLRRDPRLALHSAPIDTELARGDARVSGRGIEVLDDATIRRFSDAFEASTGQRPPEPFHLFRVEIEEAVLTTVRGDELVLESWTPARGLRRTARK